jgi:hypothetical protein
MLPSFGWVLLGLFLFLTLSVAGMALVAAVLVRLPANYFANPGSRRLGRTDAHPILRWASLILKNVAGAAIVVLGIALSLPGVPGPGILTILLGIMLMDFPGKRRLERWMISRPRVLAAVNRLRHRHGKPAFVLEDSV